MLPSRVVSIEACRSSIWASQGVGAVARQRKRLEELKHKVKELEKARESPNSTTSPVPAHVPQSPTHRATKDKRKSTNKQKHSAKRKIKVGLAGCSCCCGTVRAVGIEDQQENRRSRSSTSSRRISDQSGHFEDNENSRLDGEAQHMFKSLNKIHKSVHRRLTTGRSHSTNKVLQIMFIPSCGTILHLCCMR